MFLQNTPVSFSKLLTASWLDHEIPIAAGIKEMNSLEAEKKYFQTVKR